MYCKIGQYTGTGAAQSITIGWTPDVVMIDPAGTVLRIRAKEMPVNTHIALAGTQGVYPAADANQFKTLDSDGFSVGSGLSTGGVVYNYIALRSGTPKDLGAVLWTRSLGADSRNITGLGFQPDVIYAGSNTAAEYGRFWHKDRGGDSAGAFSEIEFWRADRIQSVSTDGFQVGTALNAAATNYAAVCFKQSPNCEVNFYEGNGAGNRIIPLNIVNPAFILSLARYAPGNQSARGPYRTRYNAAGKGYQINSLGDTTQSWTAFTTTTATVDTVWNAAGQFNYFLAFSEQDSDFDPGDLPDVPGGAGAALPFAPYQRYKALRALGQVLNNVVIGP